MSLTLYTIKNGFSCLVGQAVVTRDGRWTTDTFWVRFPSWSSVASAPAQCGKQMVSRAARSQQGYRSTTLGYVPTSGCIPMCRNHLHLGTLRQLPAGGRERLSQRELQLGSSPEAGRARSPDVPQDWRGCVRLRYERFLGGRSSRLGKLFDKMRVADHVEHGAFPRVWASHLIGRTRVDHPHLHRKSGTSGQLAHMVFHFSAPPCAVHCLSPG